MAGSSAALVYVSILHAKTQVGTMVNLWGKISEVGIPKKSKGTDFVVILKIIDSSYGAGFSVNFFAKDKDDLPRVRLPGDIICLHQVEVKIHMGDIYCLFKKRHSSFALFDGKANMNIERYQMSAKYCASGRVSDFVVRLQKLPIEHQSDTGLFTYVLRNIEIDKTVDLVCKVIHSHKISEDVVMIFVWDGTNVPPLAFKANLDMEKDTPTPLHPEPFLVSREILSSFPCVGTVFRIAAFKFHEEIRHLLQYGDTWVKIYNVSFQLRSEILLGVMNASSRIFIVSDEDGDVKYRKRVCGERIKLNIAQLPVMGSLQSHYITVIDYENVPYATLMQSITNDQISHTFKCIVRVVAACPWHCGDLRSPNGCYRVRLTLEDPTARVQAYIYPEEGMKFFGDNLTPDDLTRKMLWLLGANNPTVEAMLVTRNPPWIKCCLLSDYLDAGDMQGSRRYRIMGTKILDQSKITFWGHGGSRRHLIMGTKILHQ